MFLYHSRFGNSQDRNQALSWLKSGFRLTIEVLKEEPEEYLMDDGSSWYGFMD